MTYGNTARIVLMLYYTDQNNYRYVVSVPSICFIDGSKDEDLNRRKLHTTLLELRAEIQIKLEVQKLPFPLITKING